MPREGVPIDIVGLTKRFGPVLAVNDISFHVEPGRVTGFLGPNGAGKTTTLRCVLGLVTPTAGTATIGGRHYRDLPDPVGTVGAALEAASFHPGRSARNHLKAMTHGAGVPDARIDEVLDIVSLAEVGDRRAGTYSMGMRQRLGLAAALLGDPPVLVLDEPANGLDPAGIAWLRGFLRDLAGEGRTVLISSHVLSEVQQTVEDVLILANGRLIRQGLLHDLEDPATRGVLVRTPTPERLRDALWEEGMTESGSSDAMIRVTGSPPAAVGAAAFKHGVELHELYTEPSDLERTFLELTTEEAQA
ncbi:MAG: ATP-binding cassette domain-containing protein [Propionibacteriales bacterium]|nr:ATP-binding cassette domain-containing protein [Propionibacteriales bacterium]